MRSGSAAIARNGKIDVMPMTWNSACAREREKMAPSFALPYGRARKRTRRIRSATLWINRDKEVPSYTFKNKWHIAPRNGGTPNYLRHRPHVKGCRAIDPRPIMGADKSAFLLKDAVGIVAIMKSPILSCAIILTLSLGALSS